MEPKTALVTGGSRGLGLATAKELARQGWRLVITARDQADGDAAAAEIRAVAPAARVEAWPLDLASQGSVRAFAERYLASDLPLHLLLENAGIIAQKERQLNDAGLEMQFAVNHLGHFLLTELLLERLKASAPARIVVVSSTMHIEGVGPGKPPRFEFDNLDGHRDWDGMVFYRNSKLANMWFTYALARRLEGTGVTVNSLCPGFVPATAVPRATGFEYVLFRYVFPWLPGARTVDQAAKHIGWVSTAPELEGVSGKFYADLKERPSSDRSYDQALQEQLWTVSEELVGAHA